VGQPLLFANVEPVAQAIEAQPAGVRVVIVDLTRASAVDASAARTLADCGAALAGGGRTLLVVRPAGGAAQLVAFEDSLAFERLDNAIGHGMQTLQHKDAAAPPPALETAAQQATRLLLPQLGPIAPVLVMRAERDGGGTDRFYRTLAAHLPTAAARHAFLDATGHSEIDLTTEPPGEPR
jgi:hypothetical protein